MAIVQASMQFDLGLGFKFDTSALRPVFLPQPSHVLEKSPSFVLDTVPFRKGVSLVVTYYPGQGFALVWSRRTHDGVERPTMITMADASKMDRFIADASLSQSPLGALVGPEVAFRIIEDFGANPDVLSGAAEWIDVNQLEWPLP